MADLFAGLESLSFRRWSRRQAAVDATLIQAGVIGSKPKPMRRNKSPAISGSSKKPRTGGKPRTGCGPIDTSLVDEWEKRRPLQVGGGGGGAAPLRTGSRARPKVAGGASPPVAKSSADNLNARVRVASGSQAAVVKIASYAAGGSRLRALVQYQSRGGKVPLEREDGSTIAGSEELAALATEWTNAEREREPTKDVLQLTLTIEGEHYRGRAGHSAIETALRHALPGHRFAWASEDRADGTTHVELVISAAARRQDETARARRIFDNRKSLAQLGTSLDRSFGTHTDLDVRGFVHGVEGTARYLTQLTRGGTRIAQTMRLEKNGSFAVSATLIGHGANLREARDWKRDLRSQEARDVAHIILSAKPGTDKGAFVEAARAMLAREFAGHKYAFALHEDRQHNHIHTLVKMKSETGERLDPKIPDLSRWRETLAHEARQRHIPMEALSRFERANPPGYKLKDIRRVERGIAPDNVRRRVEMVRDRAVHVPVREEGWRRASTALQGWAEVEAIAAKQSIEPALAAGATRLYRADRPGAALTSAPLFTRDREAAIRMAAKTGGIVSYVDVPPSQLSALKPSRTDPVDQFVISAELAAARKTLESPTPATILQFRQRAETAAAGINLREQSSIETQPEESDTMAKLQTMKAAFDDMNMQLNIVERNLPADKLPELAQVRKKIEANQRKMLAAQENIERKRGSVEGDKFVSAKPKELDCFVAEERSDSIRYTHRDETGKAFRLAFVDTGKKVEIHDWKDRETVLAAMQVSAEKWGGLTVTGTDKYKAMVVELAVGHGFRISNPELQDKITIETTRVNRQRAARAGFTNGELEKPEQSVQAQVPAEGNVARVAQPSETLITLGQAAPVQPQPSAAANVEVQSSPQEKPVNAARPVDAPMPDQTLRNTSEISLALEAVRGETESVAARETGEANESTRTNQKPFDDGGSDHAYPALRAERAVKLHPKQPVPADIHQSPEVERLQQHQAELLKEKGETEKAETQKKVPRPRQ
jgi:hypothetical protein